MKDRKTFFGKLVNEAGEIAMENWSKFKQTTYKTPRDPVTEVDRKIEQQIAQMISEE